MNTSPEALLVQDLVSPEWLTGDSTIDQERQRLGLKPLGAEQGGDRRRSPSIFDDEFPSIQLARDVLNEDLTYSMRRDSFAALLLVCGGNRVRLVLELGRVERDKIKDKICELSKAMDL